MEGRRQTFQNNPELRRFVLPGVRLTGKQLGVGSYGSVEELEMNGLVCAGKRLHEALLEQGNAGVADIARKYLLECQVMAEMRHPHIVQFLGLCFLEGSPLPVLVMERLDNSLDNLLETSSGLPLALKQSLLADVARGLLYLHTRNPPVVHRDLSARNVLLTSSLVAKISDLGNARIVNLQPGQLARTLTRVPGTHVYMPPESFDQHSQYGPQLDIFSFGHLALFTLTQVFPGALLPHTYADPENPGRLLGRSEVQRRTDYIQPLREQLGEQHPLLQLVCWCLHNVPAQRPSAEELLQQLEAVRPQIKGKFTKLQVAMMSVLETEVGEKDGEIECLQHDLQQVQAVVEAKDTQLQQKDIQLQQKDAQLQHKDAQLQHKDAQLQHKDAQIQQQATELREGTLQLHRQQRKVQTLREGKRRLQAEVEAKNAEIDRQQRELQTLREERERLQAEVECKDAEMDRQQRELQILRQQAQQKDAEVHLQQRELQALRIQKVEQVAAVQQLQAEMDARIAEIQQQLRERDAEINRLQTEIRLDQTTTREECVAVVQFPPKESVAAAQSSSQKPETCHLSELTWRRLPNMPRTMLYPQSVTVDEVVYIADRGCPRGVILRYDPHTNELTELAKYQYWRFTMSELTHQLVMVGGYDMSTYKTTTTVSVYSTSQKSWKQPYPPMNTPRMYPAVSTYHQRLVVAGGCDDSGTDLAAIEILNTSVSHSQWLSATPLPVNCRLMSPAIIHGTLYLLGGTLHKQVLSVSLPALIQTDKPPTQWRTLPKAPLESSTAIAVHGYLLVVGGSHGRQRSSAILVYDQEKNVWNKVGDLPTNRQDCACCLLPSGEILVAGGDVGNYNWTRRMDVAYILNVAAVED